MTGRIFVEKPSPWSVMDEYDPQLHGQPEQHSPAPQRWLAFLVVMAVVCAIVMVMS